MDKFLTPCGSSSNSEPKYKKQKHGVDPSYFERYGVVDIDGKGICVVCSREIANESLKPNKLERHLKTHANIFSLPEDGRKRVFQRLFNQLSKSQAIMKQTLSQQQRIDLFSYQAAFLIAKHKRPYTEGEDIIQPAIQHFVQIFDGESFVKKLQEVAKSIPFSNDTITRRIHCIADDLREQILDDFRSSPWTGLALDESTDITSQPQLLLFGRYVRGTSIVEELLGCLTLELTTRGEDIFNCVNQFFTSNHLDWKKVAECSIDGAPAMIGKNIGFRGVLLRRYPHISVNHCLLHREALASKDLSPSLNSVMNMVVKVVNFVKARDLNSRMFQQLCVTENSEHHSLLIYTAVRWLSRGKTLERVFVLRDELADFLREQNQDEAGNFVDPHFLARLAFLTDVFDLLNKLNTQLQGRGKWVFELQDAIKAFENKLRILIMRVKTDDFAHFPHYSELVVTLQFESQDEIDFSVEKRDFIDYLTKLQCNFTDRFPEIFSQSSSYVHVQFPFRCDAANCGDLALDMATLQADSVERMNFGEDLAKFWLGLSERHEALKKAAVKDLVKFGTTYACEAAFSTMAFIKSKYRSRLTNIHLEDNLIAALTGYTPRYGQLIAC